MSEPVLSVGTRRKGWLYLEPSIVSHFLLIRVLRNCAGWITFSFSEDSGLMAARLPASYKGAMHSTRSRVYIQEAREREMGCLEGLF